MREMVRWRILLPLLTSAVLLQMAPPLARIGTTYRVIDANLGAHAIGILAAAFALFPIFLTMSFARLNARDGGALAMASGAAIVFASILLLRFAPPTLVWILFGMSTLGIGQTLMITSSQLLVTACSDPQRRDELLGKYAFAVSLGQIVAPLTMGLVPVGREGMALLTIAALASTALLALAARVAVVARFPPPVPTPAARMGDIIRAPGMRSVLAAGSLCLASADLVLVYLPLVGEQRGIAVGVIGLLLMLRAIASAASRLFFARVVARFGRELTLIASLAVTSLSFFLLALPFPVPGMAAAIILSGFGIGIATIGSLSVAIQLAPDGMMATVMSIRTSVSRMSQFLVPALAGAIVGVTGIGGIFAALGVALAGTAGYCCRELLGRDDA